LFWLVINALMLELASALLAPGFQVRGFFAAFVGRDCTEPGKPVAEGDRDALE